MKNHKIKFVIIGSALIIFVFMLSIENKNFTNINISNNPSKIPEPQGYSTNSSNYVNSVSAIIHEAYTNYTRFNFSESESILSVPAPTDSDFNTSNIEFTITNITASNYSLTIEDSSVSGQQNIRTDPYFTSFTTINNCYLTNVSIYTANTGFGSGTVHVYLLNSTWNSTAGRSEPDFNSDPKENNIGDITAITNSLNWYTLTGINVLLDNSKTENNTWFIGLFEDDVGQFCDWRYVNDDGTGDNTDESLSYRWTGNSWEYLTRDFNSKVGLGINSTYKPSELGISVNGTNAQDSLTENNSGFIKISNEYSGSGGSLVFNFTALWYDYNFQVNETVINYTKSNLNIITNFSASSSNDVFWNSSMEIIQFETNFTNYYINYSVPAHWNILDVKNNTDSVTYSENVIGNQKVVTITDDVSNSNWTLYCKTNNLLTELKSLVDNIDKDIVLANETVDFNVTFSVPIVGNVNLSIYDPAPSNELNFSRIISVATPASQIYLGDWDIATNITQTGSFKVQVTWNNETDAAIIEKELVVVKQTNIIIEPVSGYQNETASTLFNISITYIDMFSSGNPNITGATIGYNISGGWQTDSIQNNPDQRYNITINPADYPVGTYIFMITINKTGYQNYTIYFIYHSVEPTSAQAHDNLLKISNIIRGQNASFYFNYTKGGSGIVGGVINSILINSNLEWSYSDLTNGDYVININTSNVDVGNYFCQFIIEHLPDQSQIIDFTIEVIQPTTKLILINQTSLLWRLSNKNITVYFEFNDTDNKQLIAGMPNSSIQVYNGSNPSQLWNVGSFNYYTWEVGSGKYGVNISTNNLNKGNYSAIISANFAPNYKVANLTINFYIRGNYTEFDLRDILKYENFDILVEEGGYSVYPGTKGFIISFRILDLDHGNNIITDQDANFQINITINSSGLVSLTNTLKFDAQSSTIKGVIFLPDSLPLGTYLITINVKMDNYEDTSYTFILNVVERSGIPVWVLYIIILGIIAVSSVIGIQQGVIKPRKRRYQEKVLNTASIFEDAINMQHILVIYKETGTCVYFKTLTTGEIDPNLISGLLTATQSFVRESTGAKDFSESEMKYGDYNFLISDGELVRVTLVLSKPASKFLKNNLKRFVLMFEAKYRDVLQNWKGQLNVFRDAGELADEILRTSVILPHEITTDTTKIKKISSSLSKSLLKIARELTAGTKKIFFLSQLVNEANKKLKKKPQEILLGVDELLQKGVFIPINLAKLEHVPISKQEIQLLAQKVAELPNFTDDEKQNIIKDLIEMTPAEREAALTSLQSGVKITSTVSKKAVKTKYFTNAKDAKAEINNLFEQANKLVKQKKFTEAIDCYEVAEVTAAQWGLNILSQKARDLAIKTQIKMFNYQIKNAKKQIPKLLKENKEEEAENLRLQAIEAASSMFKLGFSEYDKDLKYFNKLTIKPKERTVKAPTSREIIEDKSTLIKKQKELLKKALKAEKRKELGDALEYYSELISVADKLFKMGVVSVSTDIKKYKSKLAEIRNKIKESEEFDEEEINEQRSKMLNIALEAEKSGDTLKAIVAYQQVINLYRKVGDVENANKIESKVKELINSIENIGELIESIISSAEEFYNNGNYQKAFPQYQYAKALCQAVNDRKNLDRIQKRLDEITLHL
ncbi:MAG: hypothetical protein ACTSRZ_06615 [Promethearchaeota archaeon]